MDVLKAAKDELNVTWDELAKMTDISARALKTYRMPPESQDHRAMPKLAFNAVATVLKQHREKKKSKAVDKRPKD